jgi:hypothetical protein
MKATGLFALFLFALCHISFAQACDDENIQLALKLRSALHSGSEQDVRNLIARGACINGPKNTSGYKGFIIPIVNWAYDGSCAVRARSSQLVG